MRITKTISIYEDTQKKLTALCEKSGMGESELIREMIDKVSEDKVELTILMHKFLEKNSDSIGKERLLRIMSNRKSQKAEAQRSAMADSLNSRLKHIPNAMRQQEDIPNWDELSEEEKQNMEEIFEIANTPWVED